ncbi:MAG: DUF6340 family protein [Salinivirgaceae bacterium]|nr:DUF6340 family protein [Salinivirgaceae bacterium]
MRINYSLVLIVIVSTIISGCYTLGTVEIEVIKPAKIVIPAQVSSLVIVNNSLLYPIGEFKNEIQKGLFKLDTTSTQLLVAQVNNILNESPRFDTCILMNDIYFRNSGNLLQPIDWDYVQSICKSHKADALLSLEAFGIVDTIQKYSYYDGFGYTLYKSLELNVNSMWRIYQASERKIVEKRIHRDTLFFDQISSKNGYQNAIKQQRAINYLANEIALSGAVKIADRIAPYWQPVMRDFYIYESEEMRAAAKFAYSDDWKKAALIWKGITKNKNARLAAAACHNMALVCEVEGRLDLSQKWLEESIKNYSTYITVQYLKDIKYRISETDKLNKQFGVE